MLQDLQKLGAKLQMKYLSTYQGQDKQLPLAFKQMVNEIDGSSIVYNDYSFVVTINLSAQKIFFPNQLWYIAASFADYYKALSEYTKIVKVDLHLTDTEIKQAKDNQAFAETLLANTTLADEEKYLVAKFLSDYAWWYGGKGIERADFHMSPILALCKLVNASQGYVADLCRFLAKNDKALQLLKNEISDLGVIKTSRMPLQQIFYGAPGTGKSHGVKKVTDKVASEFVFRTTFHPDSDYSTFVGAYKPTMKQLPIFNQQTGAQIGVEDKIVYSFVPQAFLKAYVAAWQNPEQPVFLVIEEINRGNCAQIFGDIFQLLDRNDNGQSEYPIKADQDIRDHLAKEFADVEGLEDNIQSGEELVLPSNLHIWATMNTSDQSLFPIDSAFKRRWDWKYMPIHDAGGNWTIALSDMEYDWWDFVEKINKVIGDMTSSEDKKLGYFFCKACDGKIDAEKFVNKVVFYLWNDVFKDYELSNKAFDDVDGKLNFNKFYTPSGEANEETIIKFLGNLEVEISEYNHEGEDDDELEDDSSPVISQRRQKCKDFWTDFLEYTQNNSEYQKIFGGRKTPTPTHWYTYSVFNRPITYLCVDQFRGRDELSISITMDKPSYIKLEESYKAEIEQKLQGISLEWTRDLPKSTKKSSIKEVISVIDFDGPQQQELFNHIIDRLLRMYSVFNEYLTKLPK